MPSFDTSSSVSPLTTVSPPATVSSSLTDEKDSPIDAWSESSLFSLAVNWAGVPLGVSCGSVMGGKESMSGVDGTKDDLRSDDDLLLRESLRVNKESVESECPFIPEADA